MLEERRQQKRASTRTFDDLVDKDGILKDEDTVVPVSRTTATEHMSQPGTSELKKRKVEAAGAAMGATLANPFADEVPMEFFPATETESATPAARSRSSTPTLPATSPREQAHLTPQTPETLLINADDLSTHPSEQLVDLTPTSTPTLSSPCSPHHNELASLSPISPSEPFAYEAEDEAPPPAPWPVSINEWAENTTASFYSAPQSQPETQPEGQPTEMERDGALTPTISESGEHVSQLGGSEDMDVMSEIGGISTPGSWTEVGSDSGEEY